MLQIFKPQYFALATLLFVYQTGALPTNTDTDSKQVQEPLVVANDAVQNETSVCFEPKDTGPCRASVLRYYYNQETGKCEPFNWGGCNGNGNKFEFLEECTKLCTNEIHKDGEPQPAVDSQVRKSVCELEIDPGNCLGSTRVWAYDSQVSRCKAFSFTGCGGNANHFNSEAECLSFCGSGVDLSRSLEPLEDQKTCRDIKCPGGVRHYQELGCEPVYDSGACCPTRFKCPDSPSKNGTQCAYKGKIYNLGDSVPDADSGKSCRASCTCTLDGISCASIECPDLFGYYPKPNCTIGLYKAGECCAYDFACGNETTTCEFEGNSYYEGQKMYPRQESCLVCFCKPGFNGTLTSEFCEEIDCGIQVWNAKELERGCSPIYFNHTDEKSSSLSCCPIMWHCPDEHEDAGNYQLSVPQPPRMSNEGDVTEENSNIISSSTSAPGATEVSLPESTSAAPTSSTTASTSTSTTELVSEQQSNSVEPQVPTVVTDKADTTETPTTNSKPCEQPLQKGNCRAFLPHYHFNNTSGQCEEFIYTGCGGNENRFVSLTDCKATCTKDTAQGLHTRFSFLVKREERKTSPCTLPLSQGRCRAFFPRYFFNPELNKCQLFIFGGCGRNENNFFTFQACASTCLTTYPNVCDRPPRDLMQQCSSEPAIKYYYDTDTSTCLPFNSTGCSTSNVFTSRADCLKTCAPETKTQRVSAFASPVTQQAQQRAAPSKACSLPKRTGPCYASFQSYYYDTASGTCQEFLYGGCMGNGNRFTTLDLCKEACERSGALAVPFSFGGQSRSGVVILPVPELATQDNITDQMIFTRINSKPQILLTDNSNSNVEEDSFNKPQVEDPSLMNSPSFNLPQVEDPSLMRESSFYKPQVEDPSLMQRPSISQPRPQVEDPSLMQRPSISQPRPQVEDPSLMQRPSISQPQVEDPSLMQESSFGKPQVEDPSLMGPSSFNLPQIEDPSLMVPPSFNLPQVEDPSLMVPASFNLPQVEDPSLMIQPSTTDYPTLEAKQSPLKPQVEDLNAVIINLPVATPIKVDTKDVKVNSVCLEPLDAGTCDQEFLRFAWDGASCRPFNYTGCGGNKNNFRTEYACLSECDSEYRELQSNSDCYFGDRVIPYGSSLTEYKCSKEHCSCVVPPSLTCTLRPCSTVVPDN